MNTVTQHNAPVIAGIEITTDSEGRFKLNALHKASELGEEKAPSKWLRSKQTQELVRKLTDGQICPSPLKIVKGGLNNDAYIAE